MAARLFVISAPSGSGKSTIIEALKSRIDHLGYSVSHTSRKPRVTEKNGLHYHFVELETFKKMIGEGAFVEWAKVYDDYYGTSFSSLDAHISMGLDVLIDVDPQGAKNIKKHYERSVLIYILPPSLEVLEKRLRGRATDDRSVVENRLKNASKEIENWVWYDYAVVNDDLERAVEKVKAIILAERCRAVYMRENIKKWFGL